MPELTTLRDAYSYFSDLHGSERPEWDQHQLRGWLYDQGYSAPYTEDQLRAAYDAEIAVE